MSMARGSIIAELKRRNVLRVGAAYLVAAWLLVQVAETILPLFGFDETPTRILVIVLAIGILPALVLTWVFELTPEGLVRDTGDTVADPKANRRFDRVIIAALVVAVALFAAHTFVIDPARDAARIDAATQAGRTEAIVEAFGDKSIAVLPFRNMSTDPERDFFAEGIAEELLNLLAKVNGLRVISRTSSFQFKDADLNIPEIAKQLGVAHVLEGSVRWSGNTIRITAQLIAADSDTHLWSETYDRDFVDIFAIQDEVAASVVEELKVTMEVGLPTAKRHDPEAYALFVQAMQLAAQADPTTLETRESLLLRAVEIEPDYLDAKLWLSRVSWRLSGWASAEGDQARLAALRDRANALRDEVEAVDPTHPGLNVVRGWEAFSQNQLQSAADYAEIAIERAPRDYEALVLAGKVFEHLGRLDTTTRILEYLTRRDPLGFWANSNLADLSAKKGDLERAIESYRTALAISPGSSAIRWKLGAALLMSGQPEAALEQFGQEPDFYYRLHGTALALNDLGDTDGSEEAMAELLDAVSELENPWLFGFARAYAWLGDADRAFEYLYQMRERRSANLAGFEHNPYFRKMRDDPRWQPLVDEIEEAVASIEFNPKLPPEILVGRQASP